MDSRLVYPWLLVVLLCGAVIYAYEQRPKVLEADGEVSTLILPDGSRYSGELQRGLFHGQGRWTLVSKDEYDGVFVDGQLEGPGHYRGADGTEYQGDFSQGEFHGQGEYRDGRGARYQGQFVNGAFTGSGEYWGAEGEHYTGEFQNWYYHGQGVLRDARGVYTGRFQHGYFDGEGELRHADSNRVDSGSWNWGEFNSPELAERKKAQAEALEAAIYHQSTLIDEVTNRLLPSDPDHINLYFVGVGGYSRQDVFRKELDVIHARMDESFGSRGRSLLLLNHNDTLDQWPLATITGIRKSLEATAGRMDAEKDILFVYLTSHGSKQHEFNLVQEGLTLPDLTAAKLGDIIKSLPVRWKVVVVSACYSGGFIPHLEAPDTLVITAARKDRRSFGCGDDSDMTYFGRAYFVDALPEATSFEQAFDISRQLIREREKALDQNVRHSHPQLVMGEEIREYLPRFWQQRQ